MIMIIVNFVYMGAYIILLRRVLARVVSTGWSKPWIPLHFITAPKYDDNVSFRGLLKFAPT